MGFINLPTLLQKVKVDTKDMLRAARQADDFGDKYDDMAKKVDKSSDKAAKSTRRVNSVLDDMQDEMRQTSAAARRTVSNLFKLGNSADDAADDVRSLNKEMKKARSRKVDLDVEASGIKEAQEKINKLEKEDHKVALDLHLNNLKKVRKAIQDSTKGTDVEITAELKNLNRVKDSLKKVTKAREISFMAKLFRREKIEDELDDLTKDRKIKVDAKVNNKTLLDSLKAFNNDARDHIMRVRVEADKQSLSTLNLLGKTKAKISAEIEKTSLSMMNEKLRDTFRPRSVDVDVNIDRKGNLGRTLDLIKSALAGVTGTASSGLGLASTGMKSFWDALLAALDQTGDMLAPMQDLLTGMFEKFTTGLGMVKSSLQSLGGQLSTLAGTAKENLSGMLDSVKSRFDGLRESITDLIGTLRDDADVEVTTELNQASTTTLRSRLASLFRRRNIEVDTDVDTAPLEHALDLVAALNVDHTANIDFDVHPPVIPHIPDQTVGVDVDVDNGSVQAANAVIAAGLHNHTVEVNVDVDRRGFFRSSVRAITGLFSSLSSAASSSFSAVSSAAQTGWSAMQSFGQSVQQVVSAFGSGGGGLSGALSGASNGFNRMGGPLAKVIAAFFGLTTILPGLIAGISTLGGVLASLAGGLVFALSGAILPMIPALGALAAGFGTLMLAMKADPNFAKALKKDLEQFQESVKDATAGIRDEIERLAGTVLKGAGELVRKMAPAVTSVLKNLNEQLKDSKNREAFQKWGEALPGIFAQLGKAANNVFTGMLNFFVPILPYAQKLADAIENITRKFADWAKSVEGQKSISDFMKRAWEDAKQLWGTLTNLVQIVGTLFNYGEDKGGGGSFLEKMNKETKKWLDYLQDPKNKAAIDKFFEDAKSAGKTIVDTFESIGNAISELNTEDNRKTFDSILGFIKGVVKFGGGAVKVFSQIGEGFQKLIDPVNSIFGMGEGDKGFFATLGEEVENWKGYFKTAEKYLEDFGQDIYNAYNKIIEWFNGLPDDIGNALVGLKDTLVGWVTGAVGGVKDWLYGSDGGEGITDWFKQLPEKITTGLGDLKEKVVTWVSSAIDGALEWLSTNGGKLGQWFLDLPTTITNGLGDLYTTITTWVSSAVDGAYNWLVTNGFKLWTWFTELPGKIISALTDLATPMIGWVSGAVDGAYNWLITNGFKLWTWFTELPGKITSALTDLVTPMIGWVSGAIMGAYNWLTTGGGIIVSWFAALPGKIMNAVSSLIGRLASWATTAVTGAWTSFSRGFTNVVSLASGLPSRVIGAVSSLIGRIAAWAVTTAQSAWSALSTGFSNIVGLASGLPSRVIGAVSSLISRIGAWAVSVAQSAWRALSTGFSNVVALASGLPSRIIGAISGLAGRMYSTAVDAGQRFYNALSQKLSEAVSYVAGIPGRVVGAIGDVGSLLWDKGWSIAEGFFNGVKAGVTSLKDSAVEALKNSIPGPLKNALQINSPSKIMIPIGTSVSEGVAVGMEKGTSFIYSAHEVIKSAVQDAKYTPGSEMHDVGRGIGQSVADGIMSSKDAVVEAMHAIGEALDPGKTGLSKKFSELASSVDNLTSNDVSRGVRTLEQRFAAAAIMASHQQREQARNDNAPIEDKGKPAPTISITNYNPVAEKSSQTAARNIVRIAQLAFGD